MPIPGPQESKDQFIDRCMGDEVMTIDFEDGDQRFAVCNTQWDNKIMKSAKFYVNIQKAAQEEGRSIIRGVASGTLLDKEGERVSLEVLNKFAEHINSYGMVLSNGHQFNAAAVDDDLGDITKASVVTLGDNEYEMIIEAELDMDNPNSDYIVKKINKGKKLGFSIDAIKAVKAPVYDSSTQSYIYEYTDAIPQTISVTPRPAYEPSFIEVLNKSYKEIQKSMGHIDYPADAIELAKGFKDKNRLAMKVANHKGLTDDEVELIANLDLEKAGSFGGKSLVSWAKTKLFAQEDNAMPKLNSNTFNQKDMTEEEEVKKAEETQTEEVESETTTDTEVVETVEEASTEEATEEVSEKTEASEGESIQKAVQVHTAKLEKSVLEAIIELKKSVDKRFEEIESVMNQPVEKKSKLSKSYSEVKAEKTEKTSIKDKLSNII